MTEGAHDGDDPGRNAPPVEPLFTTRQVAERLQTTEVFVRTVIGQGKLRAYLPGGRKMGWRIPESAIQDWLRSTEQPSSGSPDDPSS